MPQLDFRQALASPSDNTSLVIASDVRPSHFEEVAEHKAKRALPAHLPRLHGSDRTTLLFGVLVFVGGLFCVFCFFNGAEMLRAAAAWSREFLYPRPTALAVANSETDISQERDHSLAPIPPQDPNKSDPVRRNDTAPFGRNVGSLYPSSDGGSASVSAAAGLPSVTLPSGPGSLLDQLNLPPAGGGALAQTFDRAVAEIRRLSSLYANAPIKVVQAPAAQTSRKVNAQLKKTAQTAQNAILKTNAVQQRAQNVQQRTSQAVNSTRLGDPNATVISGETLRGRLGGSGLGSGLGGSGLGGLGGLGHGGGAMGGGAAGLGGGIGAMVGGAVGGLGGGK